ncbi:MAG TPA: FctA domain-containing protein, partial [Lachnospiraceae bacterium]|nr:FctA domain-containing protein [Lachnospiraceae bacterium]
MYAGAINVDNRCVASFLAPDAAITANQNVDGSIIANVVNINGESHRNDFVRSITGIIALTKVATEDTSKILPGATFGVYSDSSCTNLVTTITSTATGKDVSSALPIGNYYVKETTPPSGYQLNDTVFTVVVQAGHTTIVKTGTNEYVTDTKTHVAQPTTARFSVNKAVTGNAYTGTEDFTFDLTAVDPTTAPMPSATTATCKADGTAKFGDITFDAEGIYIYKITEQTGATNGMKYNTSPVYAKVVVTTDSTTGNLVATVTYGTKSAAAADITSAAVPTITNTYAITTTALAVKKTVTSTGDTYSGTEDFTFTLAKGTGSTKTSDVLPSPATATCKAGDVATFGDITYTEAGDYYYTITETQGSANGMSYNTTAQKVKVTVAADATTGALTAEVKYYDADTSAYDIDSNATVDNTYTTAPTTTSFSVKKLVNSTGIAYSGNEEFTFELTSLSANAPMPTSATASCKDNGEAKFGDITFTAAGTYIYKITEKTGTTTGMTYSSTPVYAKVVATVTDGKLGTVVTYGTDQNADSITSATVPTVTNTYAKTENGKANLSVTKTVSSTGIAYSGTENFNFKLEAVTDGAPMPTATTASCANNGTATFGDIAYTAGGTYVYKITETAGTTDGMTYSSAAVYAKVVATVTAGKVSTVVTYGTDSNADSITSATVPTVTNTYAKTENGKANL